MVDTKRCMADGGTETTVRRIADTMRKRRRIRDNGHKEDRRPEEKEKKR